MVAFKHNTSRAASVLSAANGAHEILKRRNKPYKTEKHNILAKRKKLDLHTSYYQPPHGFQFLPIGTPDLAERCKELSRQRGFPVNVVNSAPVSRDALRTEKVSHHVHRIGYHFRSEIIEEACQDLGYVLIGQDRYVKQHDLEEQNRQNILTRILNRHGVQLNQKAQETPEQVRSAIKELFPRIPDYDLNEIVQHAWEEGTKRVGNNTELDLPRRVQLATIARIRHTYTDYDRLLKAFEWKEARAIVEPECLRTLMEWRGEHDDGDDELEEIVRETIVIDDDSEDDIADGGEADDEDSVTEIDTGNASDTSIEISHRVAIGDDLRPETPIERRVWRGRLLPQSRSLFERSQHAKQLLGDARRRQGADRQGFAPQLEYDRSERLQIGNVLTGGTQYPTLHDLQQPSGKLPEHIVDSSGRVLRLIPEARSTNGSGAYARATDTMRGTDYVQDFHSATQYLTGTSATETSSYDRPLLSIEQTGQEQHPYSGPSTPYGQDPREVAYRLRPVTPDSDQAAKRRRVVSSPNQLQNREIDYQPAYPQRSSSGHILPQFIDSTSARRPTETLHPLHGAPVPIQTVLGGQPRPTARLSFNNPGHQPASSRYRPSGLDEAVGADQSDGYDPTRPLLIHSGNPPGRLHMLPDDRNGHGQRVGPVQHQPVSSSQYIGLPTDRGQPPTTTDRFYAAPLNAYAHPGQLLYAGHPRATPLVHGATAPIQQLPRYPPHTGSSRTAAGEPRSVNANLPVNGAPAPTQYYSQR